jgi:hypothetical protein
VKSPDDLSADARIDDRTIERASGWAGSIGE